MNEETTCKREVFDEIFQDPRITAILEEHPERKEALMNMARKLMSKRKKRNMQGSELIISSSRDKSSFIRKLSTISCASFLHLFTQSKQSRSWRKGMYNHSTAGVDTASILKEKEVIQKRPNGLSNKQYDFHTSDAYNREMKFKVKTVQVHLNGETIPTLDIVAEKFHGIEALLRNAILTSTNLNCLKNKLKYHTLYDQSLNDHTNWKFTKVLPVSVNSYYTIYVLEPKKFHINSLSRNNKSVNMLNINVSSSTQTDINKSFWFESELSSSCISQYKSKCILEKIPHETFRIASKSFMANSCILNKLGDLKKIRQVSEEGSYASNLNSKRVSARVSSSEDFWRSVADREIGGCHSSGALFLSNIIKFSKGPGKSLVGPEVVLTSYGTNCCICDSDTRQSYIYSAQDSSREMIALSNKLETKNFQIKQNKTSCESYFGDESTTRRSKSCITEGSTCYLSTFSNHQRIIDQKPPEISSGYSQLSRNKSALDLSSGNETISPNKVTVINSSGFPVAIVFKEIVHNQEIEKFVQSNDYIEQSDFINEPINRFRLKTKRTSRIIKNISSNTHEVPRMRNNGVSQKLAIAQTDSEKRCIKEKRKCMKQSHVASKMKASKSENIPNSQKSSLKLLSNNIQSPLRTVSNLENKYVIEQRKDTSSNEEQLYQYERNLKIIKTKIRKQGKSLSSTSNTTLQLPAKQNKYTQKMDKKYTDKSKQKTCSLM